ncbi:hypothetical protein ACQJBY_054374 [Aegilops geniculata]
MPFSARAGAALGGMHGVAGHDLNPRAVQTVSTCSPVGACVQCTECGLPLPLLPSFGSATARRRWVWNSCPSVRQYRRRHVATLRVVPLCAKFTTKCSAGCSPTQIISIVGAIRCVQFC